MIWRSNPLVVSSVDANVAYGQIDFNFELEGIRTIRENVGIYKADIGMTIGHTSEIQHIYDNMQAGKKMRITLEFEE